eukprot:81583-Ditylum_brightwellii.AAC.1
MKQMKWISIRTVLKPLLTLAADYDVQRQIEALVQELGINWEVHHVKGHQSGNRLSWEAQLNNRADKLATEAKAHISQNMADTIQFMYPVAKTHFMIDDKLMTRNIKKRIQETYTTKLIKAEMCK